MSFRMPAAALTCTTSHALAQARQELLQRAEQESISIHTRPGLIYGLDQDVPQGDTETGHRKPILIGARFGLTVGLGISGPLPRKADNSKCIVACPGTGPRLPCGFRAKLAGLPIARGLADTASGAASGRPWSPAGDPSLNVLAGGAHTVVGSQDHGV